ncbi:hypothetical protein H9L09_12575 [Nocardioides mesophilus]|uniref:NnrS family protein n=2 Tax=Nocardioides mesophilus TaxID=433659 RepID=A0A7G9RHE7_9ACTN|nr:hypothetical protein H9L09_12575 [Nocardioides mesophilus]
MLAGLDAALMLLGLPAPVSTDRLPDVHGMLLVFGFVGTTIALERAVALRRPAGFAAPGLLGAGGLLLVSPAPLVLGRGVLLGGAVALVGVYVPLWRRQRDDSVLVQAFGAVLGVGALALWLGGVGVPVLLPWLMGFVVLTIGGERLELARLAMGPTAGTVLLLLSAVLVAGVTAALLWPGAGYPLLGVALLGLVGWLAFHDVARRLVRADGLARYMALCMLAGYFWLAVAGTTWALGGAATEGVRYDVVVHAVFLGFTLSMIMAHAPVILPAVLRRPLPYRPALLAPVALLHLSLVLRLWAGDALGRQSAWQVGGALNVTALLLFVATAAWCASTRSRR